jgi:hypothetical protein
MTPKNYQRFLAYIIDFMVVFIILITLQKLLPKSNKIIELNHDMSILNEKLLKEEIMYQEYSSEFAKITYQIDKENVIKNGINILLVCLYFVIIPYITKGYTIGLSIMKLKLTGPDNRLKLNQLLIRNIITSGLLFMVVSLLFVCIFQNQTYFISITILGIMQLLLVIISAFMIIYRKDKRGLQDIISQTKIIKEVTK